MVGLTHSQSGTLTIHRLLLICKLSSLLRVEAQFSHGVGSRTFQNNSNNANGYFEICLSCSADYPLPRLGL